MNKAIRQLFWNGPLSKFAIRVGRGLSYLDTLQYVDNSPSRLELRFVLNEQPVECTHHYLFATGASSWYTAELDKNNSYMPNFNIGSTIGIHPQYDSNALFGKILDLQISINNGSFSVVGSWNSNRSYYGSIIQDRTLTIGCAANRNIQDGMTLEQTLQINRTDMSIFNVRIFKQDNCKLDLIPHFNAGKGCFKDIISGMIFKSSGPDPFELDYEAKNKEPV